MTELMDKLQSARIRYAMADSGTEAEDEALCEIFDTMDTLITELKRENAKFRAMLSAAPSPDGEEVGPRVIKREELAEILRLAGAKWSNGQQTLNNELPYWQTLAAAAISAMRPAPAYDYEAMYRAVDKRLQECEEHLREWRMIAVNQSIRNRHIGKWLSAALEDPSTCEAMKEDIRFWFNGPAPHAAANMLDDVARAIYEAAPVKTATGPLSYDHAHQFCLDAVDAARARADAALRTLAGKE